MMRSTKGLVVGTLTLVGVSLAAADAQAMPVQPLQAAATAANNIEHVWWRGGYGWRGYGFRPRFYGYRRPFVGYYGWRRPFYGYGYGWRRPFYGYGYRRW